jgi:peptidoglycan/LPS O-acetylase OafA/YrhL
MALPFVSSDFLRQPAPIANGAVAHVRELDGIRGIAVAFVMIAHFVPDEVIYRLPLAIMGVQQFFVLSGFLITGILLRSRAGIASGSIATSSAVLGFYARRFIRLMPLFYVTLGVTWLLGLREVRDTLPWHLGYLSNVYVAATGEWPGRLSHFWSLAVEEQFYFIWPAVILFTPRRYLLAALLGVAAVGPIFRIAGSALGIDWMPLYTLPFGWLDSLAIGGVLAYALDTSTGDERIRRALSRLGFWVGVPVVVLSCVDIARQTNWAAWFRPTLEPTVWACFFAWTIESTLRRRGSTSTAALRFRPLVYIGTISYGLYVLHTFASGLLDATLVPAGLSTPSTVPGQLASWTLVSLGLASVSWYTLERPLNRLKRFFTPGPTAARSYRAGLRPAKLLIQ